MSGIVIFFDLGDTLGVGETGPGGVVTRFEPFPFVKDILGKLKAAPPAGLGLRLGVISNTPSGTTAAGMKTVLSTAGIFSFLDPGLLLYSSVEGIDKTKKAFFNLAASRAATPERKCVFVGENKEERDVASAALFVTAFHPLHVFHVLKKML